MERIQCSFCFQFITTTSCSFCGWQDGLDNPSPALRLGVVLDDRYRIGRVLGQGGFGITYLAWDNNLHLPLAIKEYLPRDCATRAPDGISLSVYSGLTQEQFSYGLDRFTEEARALARFDQHPGIVTVKNFFRAHGTGYCVMEYVAGITFRRFLEQQPGGRISFNDALKLLMPVADALLAVHKTGLLHRDIAPDNIYLTQDSRVKLLDFGAARFAAGEHSRSLSVILKPGYAPEEQYRTRGNQGAWTDVYSLAATFYRAITGQVPPESLDRLDQDDLVLPSKLGVNIPPEQEVHLLRALSVKSAGRLKNIEQLQEGWNKNIALFQSRVVTLAENSLQTSSDNQLVHAARKDKTFKKKISNNESNKITSSSQTRYGSNNAPDRGLFFLGLAIFLFFVVLGLNASDFGLFFLGLMVFLFIVALGLIVGHV